MKKSTHRRRSKKMRAVEPDEFFSNGPFKLSRFGTRLVLQNDSNAVDHEGALKKFAERYPQVVQDINQTVEKIARIVATVHPMALMHRAWWDMASKYVFIEAEADVDEDAASSSRALEYLQCLITAVPQVEVQRDGLSESEWSELSGLIRTLYSKLNFEYPIASSAHRKQTQADYDDAMEQFQTESQLYWCNVRGNYYQHHQVELLRDQLLPHSELIEAAYGISADTLVKEIQKIWYSLTFGLQDAMETHHRLRVEISEHLQLRFAAKEDTSGKNMPELIAESADILGCRAEFERATRAVMGYGLFDVSEITNLPAAFLNDFSWEPAQDTEFMAEGEFRGWPLRRPPTFKRPFLKLDGKVYCFDTHSLFDNLYRQVEKKIFARNEQDKQKWIKIRQDMSEALPLQYLQRLLPGAKVIPQAYYPSMGQDGKTKWTEVDCLLEYDDNLFVIEVKAGAFTYTSPADDFPAYVASLKALVEHPSKQGQRFLAYFGSSGEVQLYDSKRQPTLALRKGDYRNVTLCAITLDPFTELAAKAQHLTKIGIEIGDRPIWSVALADLLVYTDIFTNPLEFLHFVEQRMAATTSTALELNDELDHLGLYLQHNNYLRYTQEIANKPSSTIQATGYRSEIDRFFNSKLNPDVDPPSLMQRMHPRLREILRFLSAGNLLGRSKIASYLLDADGESQRQIGDWIEKEMKTVSKRGRCIPFSTTGEFRLTIGVESKDSCVLDINDFTEHVLACIAIADEKDRTLLRLTYQDDGQLTNVEWRFLTLLGRSDGEIRHYREVGTTLGQRRVDSAMQKGKIGRNESCPCGSGKKYKSCCL